MSSRQGSQQSGKFDEFRECSEYGDVSPNLKGSQQSGEYGESGKSVTLYRYV